MRTYIFTEEERKTLHQWLAGNLTRKESTLLHTTLGRLRRSEKSLIQDIRLLTLALRRLHLAPKLRKRTDETDTSINLAPILIHTPEERKRTYLKLIRTFHEAQNLANNEEKTTETRLKAVEIAVKIGRALIAPTEEEPRTLMDQLKQLKNADK